jgi:hypothetical protein
VNLEESEQEQEDETILIGIRYSRILRGITSIYRTPDGRYEERWPSRHVLKQVIHRIADEMARQEQYGVPISQPVIMKN